jgi:hypothetical protein
VALPELADAEIENHRLHAIARLSQKNVVGLQIAVDHARRMDREQRRNYRQQGFGQLS